MARPSAVRARCRASHACSADNGTGTTMFATVGVMAEDRERRNVPPGTLSNGLSFA